MSEKEKNFEEDVEITDENMKEIMQTLGKDQNEDPNEVPVYQKYCLTIREASKYFGIGEGKLRFFLRDHPDADYIIWIGNKCLIKRKLFELFIDKNNAL